MSTTQVIIGMAAIIAMGVAVAALLFWKENRNRQVGIASYVVGLLATVAAGALAAMAVAAIYLTVIILYMITGGIRETLELAILILGIWLAAEHSYIQTEKNRRERDGFACRMQHEWTKSITKAITAEKPTAVDEAGNEVRELYRECRVAMNNDASALLGRIVQRVAWLRATGCDPDQEKQIKESLIALIVPSIPAGTTYPVTTVILDLFRAYRQGGLVGWYSMRSVFRLAEQNGSGVQVVNSGLVEHEDAVRGVAD